MKKTLFKIMSLALTIGIIASLLVAVVPAGALTIVTAGPTSGTISAPTDYTITFTGALNLADADTISIVFPSGTNIANVVTADITFNNGVDAVYSALDTPLVNGVTFVPAAGLVIIDVPTAEAPATTGNAWSVKFGNGKIVNPGTAGNYSISVSTSKETTPVVSATYAISAPGIIQVYNAAGAYTGTYSTFGAVPALGSAFTVKVSPGVYMTTNMATVPPTPFNLGGDHVTLATTGTPAPTILIAGGAMTISGAFNTVDGFIIIGGTNVTGANVTIKNCTINKTAPPAPTGPETLLNVTGAAFTLNNCKLDTSSPAGIQDVAGVSLGAAAIGSKITNCTFKLDQSIALLGDTAILNAAAGTKVEASTFTGVNGGIGIVSNAMITVFNNTFTGLQTAINTIGAADINANLISGCITNGVVPVGAIVVNTAGVVTASSNFIKDNTGYSFEIIAIGATSQISGNNFSKNVKGFSSLVAVNAILNYWGAANGPLDVIGNPAGTGDMVVGAGPVTYRPFLASLSQAASSFIAAAGVNNFDASMFPAGASLTNYTGALNDVIILQKLAANPKTIDPGVEAVQYFDIFTSAASGTSMVLKLYASGLTAESQVYYWSAVSNSWKLCSSQGLAGTGDFVYVTINPVGGVPTSPNTLELVGTPFVIVKGFAPAPPAFAISAPVQGSETGLKDVGFTWADVTGANAYEIVISAKADLSSPVATEKTAGPAFTYTGSLAAGTYYWRVTALQNDNPIGLSAVGTFKAVAPPAPSQPPITITTQPPATITLTQTQPPAITITQQGDTTVTPAWIWGIIGIGAVLVIVVIVLIVRTRRTS